MESIALKDKGRKQNFGLNLLRAVAIIVVVFGHAVDSAQLFSSHGINILRILANYAAALFFMISGALLLPVTGSYWGFLKKRLSKIWIPFIFWSIVYAVLTNVYITHSTRWMWTEIRWLWIWPSFRAGWFIPAITSLYFFFPIISPWIVTASRRRIEYFLIWWLACGVLPYLNTIIGNVYPAQSIFAMFYNFLGYAVAGYYFMHFPIWAGDNFRKYAILSLCVGCLVLQFIFLQWEHNPQVAELFLNDFGAGHIGTACLAFILLTSVKTLGRPMNAIVNFFAVNSYGIYLCQTLFYVYVLKYILPGLWGTWWGPVVSLVGSVTLAGFLRKIPVVGKYLV